MGTVPGEICVATLSAGLDSVNLKFDANTVWKQKIAVMTIIAIINLILPRLIQIPPVVHPQRTPRFRLFKTFDFQTLKFIKSGLISLVWINPMELRGSLAG